MRVFLLDLGHQFHSRQAHVLALARLLDNTKDADLRVGCFAGGALSARLSAANIPSLEIAADSVNPFKLFRLWDYLKKSEPDIVHVFGGDAVAVIRKCPVKGRTRVFVTLSSTPLEEPERRVPAACLTGAPPYGSVCRVFCPSVNTLNKLQASGISSALLRSLPHAVSGEAIRQRRPRADGRFVFLASAPLTPESGLMTLIEALTLLKGRDDVPPWELRIIGRGKYFHKLLDRARELGVDAFLSLLGSQDPEEQLPLCDVAVTTNLTSEDRNFFMLQAWHAHVPLICSAVPSTVELLGSERNALTYVPGNSAALASAMLRCMLDPGLYQRLLKAGQTEFPRHTHEAVCASILESYEEAMATPSRA